MNQLMAVLAATAFLWPLSVPPGSEDVVFPADSGVVDLTRPPYGAKGDGVTDCTDAINRALEDQNGSLGILYLPQGTYLISNTLRWGLKKNHPASGTTLQGQSQVKTILKLKDSCAGYGDASKPKSMVWTGPAPAQRFGNSIRNLTFDVGKGNPGATGLQYIANNQGTLRDVLVRAPAGSGVTGLDMVFEN
ncbi:MAG: glycoside hydrolase family 55 protein, partial [Planctomycetaceae bacterium]|nr:glycoside hydrolase family 55 protein [Planctomycetaceae bacterium]